MTLKLDRRAAFKVGVAGAAALAAPALMTRAATAQTAGAALPTDNPGYHTFKLGEFQVTTLLDGKRPGDGPHPIFGANQDKATVDALLTKNFLPTDKFVNMFTPVLVKAGSDLILFDTGNGPAAREAGLGQTRARLEAAGYRPGDVTKVVLTHMHPDHIGGLMEADGPAYANATYVAGQTEFDFWSAPERMSGPTERVAKAVEANVKPLAEKTTFIADKSEVAPGVTAMAAPGHTLGHMIFRLESGGKQLILTADTSNHYIASLQQPDWHVAFDADKDQAAKTRRAVFDMIATDRLPFIGYHMPSPAIGFIEKIDTGYRFVPQSYQFDI